MDRRNFIIKSGLFYSAMLISACSLFKNRKVGRKILTGSAPRLLMPPGKSTYLYVYDTELLTHSYISLPISPHSFLISERKPDMVLIIPSAESSMIEFDLKKMKIQKEVFTHSENIGFYGHGCHSSNGDYLITTEASTKNIGKDTFITMRKIDDFSIVKQLSTKEEWPHDICLFGKENEYFCVLNASYTDSSLCLYDSMLNLIKRFECPSKVSGFQHMVKVDDETLFIGNRSKLHGEEAELFMFRRGKFTKVDLGPSPPKDNILSLVFVDSLNLICLTCPQSNKLIIISLENMKNFSVPLDSPLGIVQVDTFSILVNTNKNGLLYKVNLKTLEVELESECRLFFSSHMALV